MEVLIRHAGAWCNAAVIISGSLYIVKMTSDYLPLTVPYRHNSVGVSSKRKLLV